MNFRQEVGKEVRVKEEMDMEGVGVGEREGWERKSKGGVWRKVWRR